MPSRPVPRTPAEIGAKLKAGTNCGSCIPEMKRLIAETGGATGEQRQLAAAN
jgi:assimilatory nitrate reductase catalytic subunit